MSDVPLADPPPLTEADRCSSTEPALAAFKQLIVTFLKLQRQLEDVLDPFGLVFSQFEALIKIDANPGLIQQELVSHLLVTKGNVGALLDRLESMGLVERRPDPLDRRANRLHLTAEGSATVHRIVVAHRAFIRANFKPLDEFECGHLQRLLRAIEPR